MSEELRKLVEAGYRKLYQTLLEIRLLSSRSDEATQQFIYRFSDSMHNVPLALQAIHAHGDSQEWAVEMIKRSIAQADQLWIDYNKHLAEGD